MPILISPPTGLNDVFSLTNEECIRMLKNNIPLENLHIYSNIYEDLNEYFIFDKIKYINPNKLNKNLNPINRISSHGTLNELNTKYHMNNYIKFKPELLNLYKHYNNRIGIHCRSAYGHHVKEFKNNFVNKINKLIESMPNEQFSIFMDNYEVETMINKYDNVIFEHREPGQYLEHIPSRLKATKDTIHDILKMGNCKLLYTTLVQFWRLPIAFVNPNLKTISIVKL